MIAKQKARILDYIDRYGSITNLEAKDNIGVLGLSARICELRKEGYNIISKPETAKNRYGETTHYVRYYLYDERNKGV